jgi:hypothetical protein
MKSAYELALERSGGALRELPEEKKAEINELDMICKSKVAEAEITAENKLKTMSDPEQIREFKDALANEIRSIRDRYERKKEAVRNRQD